MKALAIVVLALALEAGFLLQVALPGAGPFPAGSGRVEAGAEPHAQPLAARAMAGGVPCTP